MTVYNDTPNSAFGQGFSDMVSRAAFRAAVAFSDWNNTRKTEKALKGLSDRELDDIGLTRGTIHFHR